MQSEDSARAVLRSQQVAAALLRGPQSRPATRADVRNSTGAAAPAEMQTACWIVLP
jgi:hypothetical protein